MAEATAPFDLLVIGSGPGGYTGAIRAAQLGMRVACVEQEASLGGTCLRVGCIPSKALLEATHKYFEAKHNFAALGIQLPQDALRVDLPTLLGRKDSVVKSLTQGIAGLFKKHRIQRVQAQAALQARDAAGLWLVRCTAADGNVETLLSHHVLLATGSTVAQLPGVELQHAHIGTSTDALSYETVPKHLVVIGAGAIGLELGSVWCRLGAQVSVLEYAPRILGSMDAELANAAQRMLSKQGLQFHLGARVTRATQISAGVCEVTYAPEQPPMRCDKVLLAVGRVPYTQGLNLAAAGIQLDPRGRIQVDAHFATQAPQLYAIGDVIAGPMLAHKAEDEAVACVEHIATGIGHVDYNTIASVVYTAPEIASVGLSEEQLKAAGIPYRKGSFPFLANARARAMGETEGFVKVLAHQHTDRILAVHMMGAHASDIISEAAASMAFGASSEDLARTCHPHPTLSEALKEASLAVDGRTLNI